MTAVLLVGTIFTEIFTPQFVRWMFHGFSPAQVDLTVHLTRILLPAQIFFYVGGVVSAVLLSHRLFLFSRLRAAALQRVHHSWRSHWRPPLRHCRPGLRRAVGECGGTVSGQRDWSGADRHGLSPVVRCYESRLP